jgi:hypothetical protein
MEMAAIVATPQHVNATSMFEIDFGGYDLVAIFAHPPTAQPRINRCNNGCQRSKREQKGSNILHRNLLLG